MKQHNRSTIEYRPVASSSTINKHFKFPDERKDTCFLFESFALASSPLYHNNNIQYGYLWWSIDFPYKNRMVRAFFAGGNGGQSVNVIRDLDLVIVTYAGNYATRVGLHIQQDYIPNFILPAMREAGDDKTAPVIQGNFVTPYGHSDENGRIVQPGKDKQ
jgi:hypothetical protein